MFNSPSNDSDLLMRISVSSHLTHYIDPSSEIGPEPMLIPVTGCSMCVEIVCQRDFDFKILGFRAEVIQQTSFQSDGIMRAMPPNPKMPRISFLSPEEDELVKKAEEAFIPLEIPHFEVLLDTHPPLIRPALNADGRLARPIPQIPSTLHADESMSFFLAPVTHNPDLMVWSDPAK